MIQKTSKKSSWHNRAAFVPALIVLGAMLLSACSSTSTGQTVAINGTPTATPTPSISQSLQSQGDTALKAFQQWITLVQQSGGDITTYQQQYTNDQQALIAARSANQYTSALQALQQHTKAIQIPAMKQEVQHLQQDLQQQVNDWGKQHKYHDAYNSQTYTQDYEYDNVNGIGGPLWLQEELKTDQTLSDYQQTIEDLNMWLYDFQAMKTDFSDKTPSNQAHQSDKDLLQHYNFMDQRVVIVSLDEQALRVYDHGKLVHSFLVTTGQPDLPSPPGTWWVEGKKHPTVFKSDEPKGSPHWYPPTNITYAMQYHSNGYFFHDAWWRTEFGPGSNYPHQDPDGDPFAGQGSHGCVNMSTSDSAWLYNFVSVYTRIIIY